MMADSRVDWMRNKGGNATHHFVLFDLPSSCLLVLLLFLVPNFFLQGMRFMLRGRLQWFLYLFWIGLSGLDARSVLVGLAQIAHQHSSSIVRCVPQQRSVSKKQTPTPVSQIP